MGKVWGPVHAIWALVAIVCVSAGWFIRSQEMRNAKSKAETLKAHVDWADAKEQAANADAQDQGKAIENLKKDTAELKRQMEAKASTDDKASTDELSNLWAGIEALQSDLASTNAELQSTLSTPEPDTMTYKEAREYVSKWQRKKSPAGWPLARTPEERAQINENLNALLDNWEKEQSRSG